MVNEKLYIIDGSAYFFRAFYAIRELSTSKGFPTNAILGFTQMLLKVIEDLSAKKVVIVFDTPKPSFRKDLYADYKANRSTPPEELVVQIPHIQRVVDAFHIARMQREGYEADDVIATLVAHAKKKNVRTVIISSDKDLMQLVDPSTVLFDTMRAKEYDEKAVEEKFGVRPHQLIDFLALVGDSSDNVPGVAGIGEKTAAELIRQFGSLKQIYEQLESIPQKKRRDVLAEQKDKAFLSYELVKLVDDLPLEISWSAFEYPGPDQVALKKIFEEFEFFQLLKRLNIESVSSTPKNYRCVQKDEDLLALVKELSTSSVISLDTETTSLSVHEAELVGLSFSCKAHEAFYIPVGHFCVEFQSKILLGDQLPLESVLQQLKPILENEKIKKVGQNLKYDRQILKKYNIDLKGVYSDTLIESYLLDPESAHNLDVLALRYLNHKNISYEEVTGKGKDQVSFGEVSIEKATQYSAEDSDVALQLHQTLFPRLKENHLLALHEDVEVPLSEVLAEMEYVGIAIDEPLLERYSQSLSENIVRQEKQIFDLAGQSFNVNSPKQLSQILFEKLKLPVIRRTKTGLSTDEGVLEKLKSIHPIAASIVKYREYCKLKSTYVDGLLGQVSSKTGFVHTQFNQTITATGRLSSSNPNLQNIPLGGEYDLRKVFRPRPGFVFLSSDYSQVELRILAHYSKDENLTRAFQENKDVHSLTAQLVFGKDSITAEERGIAKTINFGVIYGQTPFGLSQQLNITPDKAKAFIDAYFKTYSRVKIFFEGLVEKAAEQGYTETFLGRRRYIPDLKSANRFKRETAERAAINAPIQGTAADLIKKAMVDLYRELQRLKLKSRIVLQVHDELVLEVADDEVSEVESLTKKLMESALPFSVPLLVDQQRGAYWQ